MQHAVRSDILFILLHLRSRGELKIFKERGRKRVKRFKRLILVVLAVAALSLLAMPAIGVSAKSIQVEVEGTAIGSFMGLVDKNDTGNNTHMTIIGSTTWTGDITGYSEGSPSITRHWGADHTAKTADDVMNKKTVTAFVGTCTIAGYTCVNVEITKQTVTKNGVTTGSGTISGDVVGGGSVHGTLKYIDDLYSGKVHFTGLP